MFQLITKIVHCNIFISKERFVMQIQSYYLGILKMKRQPF